jgi:hypothetical protein
MKTDRTVYARRKDGCEVVRYDRAGKWYLEWPRERMIPAQHIALGRAIDEAAMAAHEGGHVYLGMPGGGTFDRTYNRVYGSEVAR